MSMDDYVIIIHIPTKRAFTLNRGYQIVIDLIINAEVPLEFESYWHGWLPTVDWQRPNWIEGIPEDQFTAYWIKG